MRRALLKKKTGSDFGGVLWCRADEDIEVAREARARMKSETMSSDDQVLNAVGV